VPQCSVLPPILYSLYDASAAPETHLSLFADDICIYRSQKHERRVLCKLQRGLTALKSWCERRYVKINEGKTPAIYFSRRLIVSDDVLQLKARDITFVKNIIYLGVTFHRKMTWRLHIERTVAKALRTYIRSYSLFKSERLSTNIKLTLYNNPIRSVMTYALQRSD
jgi:hypothetical protein